MEIALKILFIICLIFCYGCWINWTQTQKDIAFCPVAYVQYEDLLFFFTIVGVILAIASIFVFGIVFALIINFVLWLTSGIFAKKVSDFILDPLYNRKY